MVTYRGQGDSIVSGSPGDRLSQFWDTLPEVARALSALAALAAVGWRRSPLLARLWLGAAALGVLGGGNFHAHYYVQLAPPLALLAGVGAARLLERRAGLAAGVCAGLALWGVVARGAAVVRLAARPGRGRVSRRRPPPARRRGGRLRARPQPSRRPDLRDVGGRQRLLPGRPRPGRALHVVPQHPGRARRARPGARRAGRPDRPVLVVAEQPPGRSTTSGETARLLESGYRLVANVGGVPIYRRR